jgi:hypothetical protein
MDRADEELEIGRRSLVESRAHFITTIFESSLRSRDNYVDKRRNSAPVDSAVG